LSLSKVIRFPSVRSNIKLVEKFLLELENCIHLEDDVLDRIMISVTEAVNNAIIHGNKADKKKSVEVACVCDDDRLEFTITDEGTGFNLTEVPDPLDEGNLLKEGGRGIMIIQNMMDSYSFEKIETGMKLRLMIKRKS